MRVSLMAWNRRPVCGEMRKSRAQNWSNITFMEDGVKKNPYLARDFGGQLQNSAHESGYADLACAGGLTKRISKTSRLAPTTIALSATLKAGH